MIECRQSRSAPDFMLILNQFMQYTDTLWANVQRDDGSNTVTYHIRAAPWTEVYPCHGSPFHKPPARLNVVGVDGAGDGAVALDGGATAIPPLL